MRSIPVLLLLIFAAPALAADGVIEINQVCAINTGCGPGDAPGYPITVRRGSYRLTGELQMPDTVSLGIEVSSSPVTIDFNGFSLLGDPVGLLQKGVGRSTALPPRFVTIRNGVLEDFDGICVELGDYGRVENMHLLGCGQNAIVIGDHGHVVGNAIQGSNGQDLSMGSGTLYRDNVLDEGLSGDPVSGGVASGVNVCGTQQCSAFPPRRRFYLTTTLWNGSQAAGPGVCAPGFHFASLWEIHEPSALQYDTSLGQVAADSGEGPQTFFSGWVRTGFFASTVSQPGRGNCTEWSSASASDSGTLVAPTSDWLDALPGVTEFGIWGVQSFSCDTGLGVWCVED